MTHPKYLFAKALQLSFIILKLCSVIAWSWWWVLAPLWITVFVFPLLLRGYLIKQDVDGLTGGVMHVTTRVYHFGRVIYKNSSHRTHSSGVTIDLIAFVKQRQREWARQFIKDYKTLS